MADEKNNYTVQEYSKIRSLVSDPVYAARKKNIVYGIYDLEIARFRKESKDENVVFFSRLLYAVARAVEKNPKVNAYRKGKKLIFFDGVDICFVVEKDTKHGKLPLPYVLRNANKKSLEEINAEVKLSREGNINEIYLHKHINIYMKTPEFLRKLFWRYLLKNPFEFQKRIGTIAVTALHGRGFKTFHFLPLAPYTMTVGFGGIYRDNNDTELMKTTLCLDHDILDGMDTMKFFKSLSES